MITYELTETGYRIYNDGNLWFVQEDEYARVYPGETIEECAQNHVADLTPAEEAEVEEETISDAEKIAVYEEALNTLGVNTEEVTADAE